MPRSPIDYHVINAIMYGADLFTDMLTYLNGPDSLWHIEYKRNLQTAEVFAALQRLVHDGLVEVHLVNQEEDDLVGCGEGVWPANADLGEMFFDTTGRGRVVYLNWDG
jgi:hypothetical protein